MTSVLYNKTSREDHPSRMATRSREEILALADPDPEFTAIWPKFEEYFNYDFSHPEKVLKQLRDIPVAGPQFEPIPEVKEQTLTFQARDGHKLRLLVFRPATSSSAPCPLIVVYHGGGGSIGSPEQMGPICRNLSKQFNAVCVSAQYRLAPEHPWPIGHHDCWDAVKWCAANANTVLNASPSHGFIIGGISNGATVCGVLMHLARDEKLNPPLTGVWLSAGSVATPSSIPDRYKPHYLARYQGACLDAPILNRPLKQLFDDCMRYDPYSHMFASLLWPSGHADLPPTYFQACGMDINRDDALIFEQVLREESGLPTRIDVYPGVPHVFWGIFPMLTQARKWQEDTREGFAWLLGRNANL